MVYTVHYKFWGGFFFWFLFTEAHYQDPQVFPDFGKEKQEIRVLRGKRAKGKVQRSNSIEISYMCGQNTKHITHLSTSHHKIQHCHNKSQPVVGIHILSESYLLFSVMTIEDPEFPKTVLIKPKSPTKGSLLVHTGGVIPHRRHLI